MLWIIFLFWRQYYLKRCSTLQTLSEVNSNIPSSTVSDLVTFTTDEVIMVVLQSLIYIYIYFLSHISFIHHIMEQCFSLAHSFDLCGKSRRSGNDVTFPSLSRTISVQHKDTCTGAQTDVHKHSHTCTYLHIRYH